jgi:predicted nucleotidyltransferase
MAGARRADGPDDPAEQIDSVVEIVRDVLGGAVIGIYLHGSAVRGGLRPGSDIDLLAVIGRPTSPGERRALVDRLLPISGRGDPTGGSRSVELTVVVQGDVRPWRYPPRLEFQYGDWWRAELERGGPDPWESPNPDLALQLEMVLAAAHPLLGPPPSEVLDPVPAADLRRAMLDSVPALLSYLDGDEANVVLTFARIWTTLVTGEIRSKDAAADWVVERLPTEDRAVLRHARAIYLGEVADDWDELLALVRPCVDHLVAQIGLVARTS